VTSNLGFRFCNQLTCDSAIYVISELDGERSTGHSIWEFGIPDIVCMVEVFTLLHIFCTDSAQIYSDSRTLLGQV
jgi:hypothetical protein